MRYYYLKDGVPVYSLKAPIETYPDIPNPAQYAQTTKETWDKLISEWDVPSQVE